jgi:hypothetical protein
VSLLKNPQRTEDEMTISWVNRTWLRMMALCAGLLCLTGQALAETTVEKDLKLETGLYYTVQRGDTLWDLSTRFYDSPWVWPDLWEKNKEIPNPHWIYPGQVVRIYTKAEIEAMLGEARPDITVDPGEGAFFYFPGINRVGFVRKPPAEAWGTIFEEVEDKELLSSGDLVYVRPLNGQTFKLGARFSLYRLTREFKNEETGEPYGMQHFMTGVIEITEVYPEFVIGKIVESYRTVKLHDLLLPYEDLSPKVYLTESPAGLKGTIIDAQMKISMFAKDFVVFIDRGEKDGVKAGQLYTVFEQKKARLDPDSRELTLLPPVDYAEILILRVEEATATAFVTYSQRILEAGDTFRAGRR